MVPYKTHSIIYFSLVERKTGAMRAVILFLMKSLFLLVKLPALLGNYDEHLLICRCSCFLQASVAKCANLKEKQWEQNKDSTAYASPNLAVRWYSSSLCQCLTP